VVSGASTCASANTSTPPAASKKGTVEDMMTNQFDKFSLSPTLTPTAPWDLPRFLPRSLRRGPHLLSPPPLPSP
jgi:hypothetical protein